MKNLLRLSAVAYFVIVTYKAEAQNPVNAYAKVTSISGTTLTLSNVNETWDTYEVDDKAIIMQMQDNVLGNTTNTSSFGDIGSIMSAGLYEVVTIQTVNESGSVPTSIVISGSLSNSYHTGTNASVQLISYPLLGGGGDYTTTGNIVALDWDGNVGGVVALRVNGTLNLLHSILADGAGFRGGMDGNNSYSNNNCDSTNYIANSAGESADKGEGIYKADLVSNPSYAAARGKILNAGGGGNSHNSGGGGGGNFSSGGNGGPGWQAPPVYYCQPGAGGLGGQSLSTYVSGSRVFMGGGGGGGEGNNGGATSGRNGGGIILLSATTLATDNSCSGIVISANGENANGTSSPTNDGAGGAGAGGSIIMNIQNYNITSSCALTVEADGGDGGDVNDTGIHGGGGGGGMGVLIFSTSIPTTNITVSTDPGQGGANNDGTDSDKSGYPGPAGSGSGTIGGSEGVFPDGTSPLPVQLINFKGSVEGNYIYLTWETASEVNNNYFEVQLSQDGKQFVTIGKVDGFGTTNEPQFYEFSHFNQFSGNIYYRLKQVDFDGQFDYSRIIYVNGNGLTEALKLNVFPNPSNGKDVRLQVFSESEMPVDISVYNVLGKVVEQLQVENPLLKGETSLKTSGLVHGIYTLELIQGDNRLVKKLVVN